MFKSIVFNFRDNGITISISIIQWAFEVMNMVLYYSYIFLFHGNSNFMDKFFSLYLISFSMIIQPAFYLNGDFVFRRNWAVKGPIKALKIALFQWLYSSGLIYFVKPYMRHYTTLLIIKSEYLRSFFQFTINFHFPVYPEIRKYIFLNPIFSKFKCHLI